MAFRVKAGKVKTVWLPVTPSTVMTRGGLVAWASGKLIAATAATTSLATAGVVDRTILATDADYATDRLIPVLVPIEKNVVWEGDVTAGLVIADRGLEQDLTNAGFINRGASTVDIALCVGVLSTTKGDFLLKINGAY
jgi:hypothetical protein